MWEGGGELSGIRLTNQLILYDFKKVGVTSVKELEIAVIFLIIV